MIDSVDAGLRVTNVGPETFVSLDGDWDFASMPHLRTALSELVDRPSVILDLRGMTFMDSTIIGALVGATKNLGVAGGSMRCILPEHGTVRRVFDLMSLDKVIPVVGAG